MITYKVFLPDDLEIELDAKKLVVSDREATFYGSGSEIIAYFYKPLGIVKLNIE